MDKVQFNTQMVNMRKTVKRAKVQLIHHLTRQIIVIRKKKGSGKQLVKNERRAGRLVKEIEVIKDLACDEVTMTAIINKKTLQAVLDNANSTAEERGTARLIHHKLIAQQVSTFRDLVTDDLLEIGKRKEKLISRTKEGIRKGKRRGSESSIEGEEEDESLEEGSEESDDGSEEKDDSLFQAKDSGRLTNVESTSLSEQNQRLREQMESRHKKSGFFVKTQSKKDRIQGGSDGQEEDSDDDDDEEDDDEGSLEDMDDDIDEMGENFNAELRELSAEFQKGRNSGQVEKDRKKLKGLDSLFVGKLSGKGHESAENITKGRKNRPGQKERHKINVKKQLDVLRRPSKKEPGEGSRQVALVDLPSLDMREKAQPKRKVIPGINAPFEKPKTEDSSNERPLPSQRQMVYPSSRRGRGGAARGGAGGGKSLMRAPAQAPEILHPSWEAKKKKKEQESKILPFTGKKITFDD
ncbi:serum response factor-binding protein 1-like [Lytechinus variegatus]|uniref:serum response factor-binding protein 1-like n=1 Tax=Lytechinus variegatus TaxID=7654 RepID=UPI001BB12C3C|nr:serum response factor-binding protein 1-like [Lytechinus variegatus]